MTNPSSKTNAYRTAAAQCAQQLETLQNQYNLCSLYRVVAVFIAAAGFILAYQIHIFLYAVVGIVAVVAFFLLVNRHNAIEERQRYEQARKTVAEEYLSRFTDQWQQLPNTGAAYLTNKFPQGKDLDLFGKKSLYQYICAANTPYGKDRLAHWLQRQAGCEDIRKRQEAVAELAQKKDFCLHLQSLGRSMGQAYEPTANAFIRSLKSSKPLNAIVRLLIWLLPAASVPALAASVLGLYRPLSLSVFSCLIVIQLFIALFGASQTNKLLHPVYQFNESIAPYRAMFAALEQEPVQSSLLTALQERMKKNGGAGKALSALEQIGDAANASHNGLAFLLFNSLCLWDFHTVSRLLAWKKKYLGELEGWLEGIGELEALISLSILCTVKETVSFPAISDSPHPTLSFCCLRHPLIREGNAVPNDFFLDHRTCIITGSNMSGKTTFLRSIGTNLVLAYAGGPVLASSFQASRMQVLTSIRVEDSISDGISTFYAELLRIKSIVDYSKQERPMLALIDEIYNGTNSRDRIIGAKETVKKLARPFVSTILTTHDFELCDMEQDASSDAINYHFSEQYRNNKIQFDYKIKKGRCQTTNAQHLLRMVGIL